MKSDVLAPVDVVHLVAPREDHTTRECRVRRMATYSEWQRPT